MIQEPQQSETVEIPLEDSMSTTINNSNKNIVVNINCNQKNISHKTQKTLTQIQPKNSKPRIFLLTRPSETQRVRLEAQTVQTYHPQKTTTMTPVNMAKQAQMQPQTKIIRIPFLPRSQVQTCSVKNNTNQVLKKESMIFPQELAQYPNKIHNTDQESLLIPYFPIIQKQTITNQLSPHITGTVSNQLQVQQESVKNSKTQNTVSNSDLSENKNSQSQAQNQTKAQLHLPLTLTSMASIELKGADMSFSQADMSGAMPPTATVEEINVPVFIDEYLQAVTSTSTTSVTTNNILNINNNNTSNNISNNNHSYEKGNEVNNCLDTFESFEFDIDLLAENISKEKEKTLKLQEKQQHLQQSNEQEQQLSEVDDDKRKQHQLHLQLMLDEILLNNKNNSNISNDNISCKSNNIINNNYTTSINNIIDNHNYNMNNMATLDLLDEMASAESLFKVAPYSQMNEDILSPDDKFLDLDNSSLGTIELFNSEEAIDINCMRNEPSLDDCFIHSQPNEIMFSSGCGQSLSSSQNIINEISKAEPHIQTNYHDSTYSALSITSGIPSEFEVCDTNEGTQFNCTTQYIVENKTEDREETKAMANPLKRNSSQTSRHMKEKRLKLRLDTKPCRENVLSQQSEINTPNVINFIDEFADQRIGRTENSIGEIYNHLISSSTTCSSVKSEINVDDTTEVFSPPNTPYSVNSISNQTNFTGFLDTAPNSPASSIATTTNTSVKIKRGRGRPAKTHSDIPDRSQIQHLSESEQKKILERAKNNEASRKSRLKHKERDNALEREEQELIQRNLELNTKLKEYKTIEKKLHRALKRQHFKYYHQNK